MAKQFVRSGLANRFRVELLDGDFVEVDTIAGDAMQWERVHKKLWQENVSPTSMLWTAWRALRRENRTNESTFEAWVDRVRDFEVEADVDDDELDDEDPTRPAL